MNNPNNKEVKPSASGILQGRGCYESIKRCDQEDSVFTSIRHHSMPFIVEQRRSSAQAIVAEKPQVSSLEAMITEKFAAGALPVLRKCIGFIFLVTIGPFYLVFDRIPRYVAGKLKGIGQVKHYVKKAQTKVHSVSVAPIQGGFQKGQNFAKRFSSALSHKIKAATIWCKLLIKHGLDQARGK